MSSSSSFPRSSRLLAGDITVTPSAPAVSTGTNFAAPPTTTTTAFVPFPTSSSPPQQPGAFFSGGVSPPLVAGLVSIGAFAVAVIAIYAWCKFIRRPDSDAILGRFADRFFPARRRLGGQFGEEEGGQGQEGQEGQGHGHRRGRSMRWRHGQGRGPERGRSNELRKAKPEMFDAWIEGGQRTGDNALRWETAESVPLSATHFKTGPSGPVETAGPCVAEVSSRAGRDSVYEEDEEKGCPSMRQMRQAATGSSTLQVAVLLQMPSPPSHTVTEAQNDNSVRGDLAIGLVEAPWTREHPSLREGEEITIS